MTEALEDAKVALDKLTRGAALASLPIDRLLRVCFEQQAEINELKRRLDEHLAGRGHRPRRY